ASQSTVRRRLESLVRRGILHFRTIVEPALLGFDTELMFWFEVEPGELQAAGRKLAAHPSIRYLKALIGEHNLLGSGVLRSSDEALHYLTKVLSEVPGLKKAESRLVLRAFKRQWRLLSPNGLVLPQE